MNLTRRNAAWLLGAGVLPARLAQAQHAAHAMQKSKAPYKPQFFTSGEHQLLNRVAGLIIPEDEHSPGAVGSADLIDLIVANSGSETQQRWRTQLAAFRALSANPEEALRLAATEESAPHSEAGRFFVTMNK